MKNARLIIACAVLVSFFGTNLAYGQRAPTRAPAQDYPLENTLEKRVADFRGAEDVVIHKVEVTGMNQQRVEFLQEIALEQSSLILAIETNVVEGTYEIVLNEPDVSKEKLENFMNSLLAIKAREGN